MRAYLPLAFQLFFFIGLLAFVVAVLRWRDRVYALKGHLLLVGLGVTVVALFSLSRGVAASSASQAALPMMIGGVLLLIGVAVQFLAIHRLVQSGSNQVSAR